MSARTMAEVLSEHHSKHYDGDLGTVFCLDPTCSWDAQAHNFAIAADVFAQHQEDMLSVAGFGLLADAGAKRDAAAAGVRSILDIWGSVGRSIVRMGELRESEANILAGEWDRHLEWNLADIARERIRAAVRGEG